MMVRIIAIIITVILQKLGTRGQDQPPCKEYQSHQAHNKEFPGYGSGRSVFILILYFFIWHVIEQFITGYGLSGII